MTAHSLLHTIAYIMAATCTLTATCVLTAACTRHPLPATVTFTQQHRLPATPVKDQGHSPLCWLYAMLATIETEHISQGDSVNLSPNYNARRYLERLAARARFGTASHSMTLRGMAPLALHLLQTDGAMPYDSYWTAATPNFAALARRTARAAAATRRLADTQRAVAALADNALGFLPRHIYMLGAEYTPSDFAQSVCLRNEWAAYTSVTHHPFYTDVDLEMPDNSLHDTFRNVPVDTLMACLDRQLARSHPVCWEGDISEPGFNWAQGTADLPAFTPLTQAERQRQLELRLTTDDHCMAIVGTARSSDGQRWYIAKNSWGTGNARKGYIYLSARYVRMKTVCLVMKR